MVGPPVEYQCEDDKSTFAEWIPRPSWTSAQEDSRVFVQLSEHYGAGAAAAVLDDYRVDEDYQHSLRDAGLPWLQFDGRAHQKLYADIILNTSPGAKAKEYEALIRSSTILLFGPKYALLRPEFKNMSLRSSIRPVKRVLLTFGGGDDRGANLFVLQQLLVNTPNTIRFLIISGELNSGNSEISKWIGENGRGRVDLKVNPPLIAPLIASCDVAVMAGGTTVYEVACCDLPMVLIAIADNQVKHSLAWEGLGRTIYLGMLGSFGAEDLLVAFGNAVKMRQGECFPERHPQRVVDGFGADRIAEQLIKICSTK